MQSIFPANGKKRSRQVFEKEDKLMLSHENTNMSNNTSLSSATVSSTNSIATPLSCNADQEAFKATLPPLEKKVKFLGASNPGNVQTSGGEHVRHSNLNAHNHNFSHSNTRSNTHNNMNLNIPLNVNNLSTPSNVANPAINTMDANSLNVAKLLNLYRGTMSNASTANHQTQHNHNNVMQTTCLMPISIVNLPSGPPAAAAAAACNHLTSSSAPSASSSSSSSIPSLGSFTHSTAPHTLFHAPSQTPSQSQQPQMITLNDLNSFLSVINLLQNMNGGAPANNQMSTNLNTMNPMNNLNRMPPLNTMAAMNAMMPINMNANSMANNMGGMRINMNMNHNAQMNHLGNTSAMMNANSFGDIGLDMLSRHLPNNGNVNVNSAVLNQLGNSANFAEPVAATNAHQVSFANTQILGAAVSDDAHSGHTPQTPILPPAISAATNFTVKPIEHSKRCHRREQTDRHQPMANSKDKTKEKQRAREKQQVAAKTKEKTETPIKTKKAKQVKHESGELSECNDSQSNASEIANTNAATANTEKNIDGKRASCHQCKTKKDVSILFYCTRTRPCSNNSFKTKRCRKKYCQSCMNKYYPESQVEPLMSIKDSTDWKFDCPACEAICTCRACKRKRSNSDHSKEASSPQSQSQTESVQSKAVHTVASTQTAATLATRTSTTLHGQNQSHGNQLVINPPSFQSAPGMNLNAMHISNLNGLLFPPQ